MLLPRRCDGCSACCFTHYIETLDKLMLTPCQHQCDHGCAIHGDHPDECKHYLCGWRKGYGQIWHRPDLSGVVMDVAVENDHPRITLIEAKPRALASASGRMILALFETRRVRFRTISFEGKRFKHIPLEQIALIRLIRDTLDTESPADEVVYE